MFFNLKYHFTVQKHRYEQINNEEFDMSESSSTFNNYVEEGSKLSSLKNLFSLLEKVGNFFKEMKKGISDVIGNVTDL